MRLCSWILIWSLFEDLPCNPFGDPPPDDPTPGVLFGRDSSSPFGDPTPSEETPGGPPPGGPLMSVVSGTYW